MVRAILRSFAIVLCAAVVAAAPFGSNAQNADPKPPDQARPAPDVAKDGSAARADEIADVGHALTGPAANAECVWLGERAVGLMWRDDLDTAFRHLDLYDRFGCPGSHLQITFRCVVRQGNIDPKATETFNARIHSCWLNPTMPPPPPPPPAATAEKNGTK